MSEMQTNPKRPDTEGPKVRPVDPPDESEEFDDPSVAIDPPENTGGGSS